MPPKKNRNHRYKRNFNISIRLLQQFIRSYSCWNCHQVGHTRHQCPHPKSFSCSYCKTPGIRTVDCGCNQLVAIQPQPQENNHPLENLIIENNPPMENLIIEVDNDNYVPENIEQEVDTETDENIEYLELHAEDDSLDDL